MSDIDPRRVADTLSALADLDRRRAALYDQLAKLLGGRSDTPLAHHETSANNRSFTRQLSAGSSALVVKTLAQASTAGRVLDRQALRTETGLSENALRGATGDIGRKWARTFPGRPNPFVGRPVWGTKEHEYSIPSDLAQQLLDEFS